MYANPYRWWNVLVMVAVLTVHVLAIRFSSDGSFAGQYMNYETWLTPASFVFYISALLYILLFGFVMYQFRRQTRTRESVRRIGPWFIISGLLSIVWIILWHYEMLGWTFPAALLALTASFAVYRKVRQSCETITPGERLFIYWPFSLCLSWIVYLTLLHLSILFVHGQWSGLGWNGEVWSVIAIVFAAVVSIFVGFANRDAVYMLGFLWADIGITEQWRGGPQTVWLAAASSALLVLLLMAVMLVRSRLRRRPRLRFK